MEILKQPEWHDFGPTFASEQLGKRHQIEVSKETVRKWMVAAGLWESRSQKVKAVHCWRPRRSGMESWCSGTRRITIGWKEGANRYATWCG
jgi:hypothetical protein